MDPALIYERHYNRFEHTYFGGEGFPCIWPNLGTVGHAKYLGINRFVYTPETIWFEPVIKNWEKDKIVFDPNNPALTEDLTVVSELCRLAGDDMMISMPDNCGNLDALLLLRGNELLTDFYEYPEEIRKALKEISETYRFAQTKLFSIIRENNKGGCTHGWMNTWAPGTSAQLQADISVMLSPEIFEEFVLPELEELTGFLDYSAYHLDGMEQIRHLDMILSLKKLNAIQWTTVDGQPKASEFIDVFKKIQNAGKCLILYPEIDEIETLMRELSSAGLYLTSQNSGNA
ncbi:MAG: trimethylamine corrinoid protein 2 [Acetivibrionales bacterium]